MPLDISKAYPENGSIIYGTITSVNCIIVVLFTPVITMVMEKVAMTIVSVIAAVALIYTDRKEFSDLYTKADKT